MPGCEVEVYIATRDADENELMRKNLRSKTWVCFVGLSYASRAAILIDRKNKIVQFCFYALTHFVSIIM